MSSTKNVPEVPALKRVPGVAYLVKGLGGANWENTGGTPAQLPGECLEFLWEERHKKLHRERFKV